MPQTARLSVEERQRLILQHYPMVRRVAYRMVSRFPSCVEADDLVTIGTLGLIDAVDRFEQSRSISFSAYARIRVQGAILDELRKADWVPRSVRDRHNMLVRAKKQLTTDLGREPTQEELAKHMSVDTTRLRELIRGSTVRVLVSMEDGGEDDDTIGDTITADGPNPLEVATRHRLQEMVRQVIGDLPEREQQIIELYYFRDLTFKEIGAILGVTESRVSQLHSRMKNRLRSRLSELAD